MSSLGRMLAVLDLFTPENPAWTAEAIASRLDYTVPTAYRYLRELGQAGLVRSDQRATYVLGPRIIEWDYQIRTGDPLINAARTPLLSLSEATGCDVVLGAMHGNRIITIHHEFGSEQIGASFGRGRRLPLFRGALSKCVVAPLPRARIRKLLGEPSGTKPQTLAEPPLDVVLEEITRIRRDGYAITLGELDPGLVGIAVPAHDTLHTAAALGFVMSNQRYNLLDVALAVEQLKECIARIGANLEADTTSG